MIKDLAEYILTGSDIAEALVYIIMLLLLLVSILIGGYLKSYVREKGKNYASKEDVEKIVEQIKITTKATETIKTSIEHGVWRKKEIENVRRKKLEEYLLLLGQLHGEISNEVDDKFYGIKKEYNPNFYSIVRGIRILYFPELEQVSIGLTKAISAYKEWLVTGFEIKRDVIRGINRQSELDTHLLGYGDVLNRVAGEVSNSNMEIFKLARKFNSYEE
ncbi:TPA: hypothetical protein ACSTNG_001934 [Serratia fonticola]